MTNRRSSLANWIMLEWDARILLRAHLVRPPHFKSAGDENAQVDMVTLDPSSGTVLHFTWSYTPKRERLSNVYWAAFSTFDEIQELADFVAGTWMGMSSWMNRLHNHFTSTEHTDRGGVLTGVLQQSNMILLQHLSRAHGALLSTVCTRTEEIAAFKLMGARLQAVINAGNAEAAKVHQFT